MSNFLVISMTGPKLVLQQVSWRCVECAIHHEWDVHEEWHLSGHRYVARTSNNRVILIKWSRWVTCNNACEASEQLILLSNGDDKSELMISIVACCHGMKLCALVAQAFQLQQWHNTSRWCLFYFMMRHNLCWDHFAFIWTQLIEVVMWQVQYTETIGWGLRVYG